MTYPWSCAPGLERLLRLGLMIVVVFILWALSTSIVELAADII